MKKKAIIYARITEIEVLRQDENGNIRVRFDNYESNGFEELEIPADICCYAIIYHNQMTDEDVAFVCTMEEPLLQQKHLFTEFLTTEDTDRFYELQNEMERHGIVAQNVEDLEYFEFYLVLEERSLRF